MSLLKSVAERGRRHIKPGARRGIVETTAGGPHHSVICRARSSAKNLETIAIRSGPPQKYSLTT